MKVQGRPALHQQSISSCTFRPVMRRSLPLYCISSDLSIRLHLSPAAPSPSGKGLGIASGTSTLVLCCQKGMFVCTPGVHGSCVAATTLGRTACAAPDVAPGTDPGLCHPCVCSYPSCWSWWVWATLPGSPTATCSSRCALPCDGGLLRAAVDVLWASGLLMTGCCCSVTNTFSLGSLCLLALLFWMWSHCQLLLRLCDAEQQAGAATRRRGAEEEGHRRS